MNRLLRLFSLSLLIACSSYEENSHRFRVYEEDGVTIAETSGGPRYEGELFEYHPLTILTENPSDEDSYLVRPTSFIVDDAGYYYVSDGADSRIAIFDQTGNYLSSFGQKGSGPGDFGYPVFIGLNDKVLSIYDYELRRTTRFHIIDGLIEVLTSHNAINLSALYRGPNSSLVEVSSPNRREPNGDWMMGRVVIFNSQLDTVECIETDWVEISYSGYVEEQVTVRVTTAMYASPVPMAAYIQGEGILITTGKKPEFNIYDFTGSLNRKVLVDLPFQPVSGEELDQLISRWDDLIRRSDGIRKARYQVRKEAFRVPDHKAFWDRIDVDDMGYIWFRVPEMSHVKEEYGGSLFRIFNSTGQYLGETRAPCTNGIPSHGQFLGLPVDQQSGLTVPTAFKIIPRVEGSKYPD